MPNLFPASVFRREVTALGAAGRLAPSSFAAGFDHRPRDAGAPAVWPFWRARPADPVIAVTSAYGATFPFRIPLAVVPQDGWSAAGDRHLMIYDPAVQALAEIWHAESMGGGVLICDAAGYARVGGDGRFADGDSSTNSTVSAYEGVIFGQEIAAGVIPHGLALAVLRGAAAPMSWWALDYAPDELAALPPVSRPVAQAMTVYGGRITDWSGGAAVQVHAADGFLPDDADAWAAVARAAGAPTNNDGTLSFKLTGIDWSRLRAAS